MREWLRDPLTEAQEFHLAGMMNVLRDFIVRIDPYEIRSNAKGETGKLSAMK